MYRLAIKNGERLESSVKDLATILHQQGKTDEACQFLEDNKYLFPENISKFDNLINNLKKQVVPSGNFLNRTLILFNVTSSMDDKFIRELFAKDARILSIEFKGESDIMNILSTYYPRADEPDTQIPPIMTWKAVILNFASNSGARKTLETLKDQKTYQFYWMNVDRKLVGKAIPYQKPMRDEYGNVIPRSNTTISTTSQMNTANMSNFVSQNTSIPQYSSSPLSFAKAAVTSSDDLVFPKAGSTVDNSSILLNNSIASTNVTSEESILSKNSDKNSSGSYDKDVNTNLGFENIVLFEPHLKEIKEDSKKLSKSFPKKAEPFAINTTQVLFEDLVLDPLDSWNAIFPISQSKLVSEIKERELKYKTYIADDKDFYSRLLSGFPKRYWACPHTKELPTYNDGRMKIFSLFFLLEISFVWTPSAKERHEALTIKDVFYQNVKSTKLQYCTATPLAFSLSQRLYDFFDTIPSLPPFPTKILAGRQNCHSNEKKRERKSERVVMIWEMNTHTLSTLLDPIPPFFVDFFMWKNASNFSITNQKPTNKNKEVLTKTQI